MWVTRAIQLRRLLQSNNRKLQPPSVEHRASTWQASPCAIRRTPRRSGLSVPTQETCSKPERCARPPFQTFIHSSGFDQVRGVGHLFPDFRTRPCALLSTAITSVGLGRKWYFIGGILELHYGLLSFESFLERIASLAGLQVPLAVPPLGLTAHPAS